MTTFRHAAGGRTYLGCSVGIQARCGLIKEEDLGVGADQSDAYVDALCLTSCKVAKAVKSEACNHLGVPGLEVCDADIHFL